MSLTSGLVPDDVEDAAPEPDLEDFDMRIWRMEHQPGPGRDRVSIDSSSVRTSGVPRDGRDTCPSTRRRPAVPGALGEFGGKDRWRNAAPELGTAPPTARHRCPQGTMSNSVS